MAAAADGDGAAASGLAAKTSKEGKASPLDAASTSGKATTTGMEAAQEKFLRPNGTEYWVRKLGIHDDVPVLRESRLAGINCLLYGPPGTGKTALIEAAFADPSDAGSGVYLVQGNGDTEVADFIGSYVPVSGTEFEWVDGPLLRAMEEGKTLYIDEAPLIDPKVMAVIYGVMDGRGEITVTQNPKRGVVKAKEGFYVVAACNPNAPGARMSEALLSRFALQFEVTTDYVLAKKLGVPAKVVTVAQNLATKQEKGETQWAPQLRELLDYVRIEKKFGAAFALRNMVSTAPENDRAVVAQVLTSGLGEVITELKVG